jgi:hypothetical protein
MGYWVAILLLLVFALVARLVVLTRALGHERRRVTRLRVLLALFIRQ